MRSEFCAHLHLLQIFMLRINENLGRFQIPFSRLYDYPERTRICQEQEDNVYSERLNLAAR